MARTKKAKPATNELPMNDDTTAGTPVVESTPDDGTMPTSSTTETGDTAMDNEIPEGYTHTVNPVDVPAKTKQEIAAEKAQAKIAAKAAKAAAVEAKKAEREAAAAAKAEQASKTKEERAAAHAERIARLAELNADGTRKYTGEMLSLADRVKQGAYVKGSTGQLRSTDPLAEALDAVPVMNVIALAKEVLGLDENPYSRLNTGQQSMNLRNRMRGAINKGTLTIEAIKEIIDREGYATAVNWAAEKAAKKAKREADAAAAKAERETKAAAKKAEQEAKEAKEAEAVPA